MNTPSEEQIDLYSFYSDLYKSIYDIRPWWFKPGDHTVEQWKRMIEILVSVRVQSEDLDDQPPLDRFTG